MAAAAVLLVLLAGCCPVWGDVCSFSKKMLTDASITTLTDTPLNLTSPGQCGFACQRKRREMEPCDAYRYSWADQTCLLGTLTNSVVSGDVATHVWNVPNVTHALPGESGGQLVLHKVAITQTEAKAYCEERGGILFEPRTAELRDAAVAAFGDIHEPFPGVPSSVNPWVGLTEDPLDQSRMLFVSDGTELPAPLTADNYDVVNNGPTETCFSFREMVAGKMRFLDKWCNGANKGYPLCHVVP